MALSSLKYGAFIALYILAAGLGGCSTNWLTVNSKEPQKNSAPEVPDYALARERMVHEQLEARDIKDPRVLAAMRKVPRHQFVPASLVDSAYEDGALPLTLGQTISQPYIVGYMTQAGSGYQAAILAEIVREVYTIEILPELAANARKILDALGYKNIYIRTGDGYMGWPEFAPFDAIIVTAAPEHIPQPLVDQLKPGGRMIIPVGRIEQKLLLVEKGKTGTMSRSTIPVRFVPMTGKAQQVHPE
jgi:protein-L-isoaspartate(D-aspartate) O-methyltransferase